MSSKKKPSKKLFENLQVEPDHVQPEGPAVEPVQEAAQTPEVEAAPPETTLEEKKVDAPIIPETGNIPEDPNPSAEDNATEEILEDVRRSLIEEEEAHEKEEQPKWWKRIGKKSRKSSAEPEAPKAVEDIRPPALDAMQEEQISPAISEPEEEPDPIDELIDLLDKEQEPEQGLVPADTAAVAKPVIEDPPAEPEKPVDIEELKKHAFQAPAAPAAEEKLSEVRAIALEGDEEVFVEVQTVKPDVLEERLSAVENALKPYRRPINFGLAFVGLIMAAIAALLVYNAYQRSLAAAVTPPPVSNLPYPTSVRLPGGWVFSLGKGSLSEGGSWNPQGAEWLQGTEVCRWVALPYSLQLEAVLRTLNPDDPIELGMSNKDTLIYKVYTIKQMSPEEMGKLDSNTPCLLIVLPDPNAPKRWVLTALP